MAKGSEPIFDVHQLAHVEIYTPDPEGTLWFFRDLIGMEVSKQEGQSVYLRAYEDWHHHTLKITEAKKPGLGHVAWRTSSPQALERRVKALEASGLGKRARLPLHHPRWAPHGDPLGGGESAHSP